MAYVKCIPQSLTSGIQEAIDKNEDGFVILLPGQYHIREKLIVRSGTMLISNNKAILVNDLSDPYQPFIKIEEYADIQYLIVNANEKSGVELGKPGTNNNINIGYLKIYNTGEKGEKFQMKALSIAGYNITINNLDIYLGNIGASFENCSDVRINDMQVVNCSTGIRIYNSNNISITNFSVDSCYNRGIQIDSTNNSYFKGTVWNNNAEYPNNNTEYACLIGKYTNDTNNGIEMNLRIIDTGLTGMDISNSNSININCILMNSNSRNINLGFNFNSNINNIYIKGITDKIRIPYMGTINGKVDIIIRK